MRKISCVDLNILAGVCFLIVALFNKNHIFVPLGFCFIGIGIRNIRGNSKNRKDKSIS